MLKHCCGINDVGMMIEKAHTGEFLWVQVQLSLHFEFRSGQGYVE